MLFGDDRSQLRRYLCEVWRKQRSGQPLEPLEWVIAGVVDQHPEYHPLLADPEQALARDYFPELGETNPFLHLGLHIAVQEQLVSNRPAGVADIYRRLSQRLGDPHQAEHLMIECLGETLWEAQRTGSAPDEARYLQRLSQL